MTELEMYELWCTLRLWANYNQLNQTIEKNWLSNSFNSHILDLLDKEEIKYRSEKRLLGYRNKGKRRLAGNANQPIIINIDDVADVIDVRAEDEFARVELLVSLKQEMECKLLYCCFLKIFICLQQFFRSPRLLRIVG